MKRTPGWWARAGMQPAPLWRAKAPANLYPAVVGQDTGEPYPVVAGQDTGEPYLVVAGQDTGEPYLDRGREGHPPRPPNRACGSPAHGSPVAGFLIGSVSRLHGLPAW